MLRKIFILIIPVLLSVPVFAQNKDAILGKWLNASGEAQIQIYKKGDLYAGKIVWLKNPNDEAGKPKLDSKNPEQGLQKRALIGAEILQNFAYSSTNTWEKGRIYDPKTGKTYDCKLSMTSSDKLDVRGFVGFSLLGRTETWNRVK